MSWFELVVNVPGRLPKRDLFRGETIGEALGKAMRSNPGAFIEVPEVAAKAELVRSSVGPRKRRQGIKRVLRERDGI